jgi:cytoplasmic iron level regulating protein YaaA (DUF328/UPF0246 family)
MKLAIALSPSKTQTEKSGAPQATKPKFLQEASVFAKRLQGKTHDYYRRVYKLSEKKAEEVQDIWNNWTEKGGTAAGWMYDGPAFKFLDAPSLEKLENDLFICSALYGLLRISDGIHGYRLDLSHSALVNEQLTAFWKPKFAGHLAAYDLILDLCSREFSSLLPEENKIRLDFLEKREGKYKSVTVFAKQMRGAAARWLAQQENLHLEHLKQAEFHGFCYNKELSTADEWIYTRG